MFGLFKKKMQVDPRFSQPLPPAAEQYLTEALEEYTQKRDALEQAWHASTAADSDLDDTTGLIHMKFADGSAWDADAQILGSFNAGDQTWQWAWGNPDCSEVWSRAAKQVRDTAARIGIWYGHEQWWFALPRPDFVQNLCAIGLKASGSAAGIEVNDGLIMIFIMLNNLRWTSGHPDRAPADSAPEPLPDDLTAGIRLIKEGRDDLLPAWLTRFAESQLYVISTDRDNPSQLMVIGPAQEKNFIAVFTDSLGLQNAVRDRQDVLFPLPILGKALLKQAHDTGRGLIMNPTDPTATVPLPADMVARFFQVIASHAG